MLLRVASRWLRSRSRAQQDDYPDNPPLLHFVSEFWHPNVYAAHVLARLFSPSVLTVRARANSYPDGKVCMSSLHPSGDNEMDNETFDIRWKPINSVSSILNSVLLILQEPNFSSPANIDASVQWQRQFKEYQTRIAALCKKSRDVFQRTNGTVFIPHPDTNPGKNAPLVLDAA